MKSADLERILEAARRAADKRIVGVALAPGDKWPVGRVVDGEFVDLDIRSVRIGGGLLSRQVFENCTFHRALVGGGKWQSVQFKHCTFIEAKVKSDSLAHWKGCTFDGCNWQRSAIAATNVIDCEFKQCRFEGVYLEEVTFTKCEMKEVMIAGRLKTVLFDHCSFTGFDFSATRFQELSFIGATISGFRSPSSDDSFVLQDTAALDSWLAVTASKEGEHAAALLWSDLEFLQKIGYPVCVDPSALTMPEESRRRILQIGRAVAEGQQSATERT